MERDCKTEKQRSEKKQRCEKRSPLQHLNGVPFHKPKKQKSSNLSSSSATVVSGEASKFCSRFMLSSNSCSSSTSSSSSSSSTTLLHKKSKTFSKIASNEHNRSAPKASKVLPRSKENEISRKPFLQISRKNQPRCITQRENGSSNAKPISKSGQRSELSSVQSNPEKKLKKGSQEFQAKTKNSRENGSGKRAFELVGVSNGSSLNCGENCTPVGRVASGYGLDSLNFGDHETVIDDTVYERANGDSTTAVKTPPVEASLSPEIHRQSHSKMLLVKSAVTPVCYGAGHLVSGVTDKRKCRRRGSLRGGPEAGNLFDDGKSYENGSNDLKESSIPLLAEASVRWHLSPCNEGHENHGIDSRNRLGQCRVVCDASGTLDALSSPSMLCGNASDSLCAEGDYSGSDSVGNVAVVESSLDTPCNAAYSVNGISSREGTHLGENSVVDNSKLSIGSLDRGNIIQTPDSDSNSDACVGKSRLEVHHSSFIWPELDSITKTLERVNLSPRSEMPLWDAPGLGFHFADMASPPISVGRSRLQKNVDSVSSCVSDTTLGNLSLSQMRISWRDGLASRIVETDELDCCCFLSDDEIDADGSASDQLLLHPLTEGAEDKETDQGKNSCQRIYLGVESGEKKENDLRIGNDLPPLLFDYEPCISTRGKEKSSSHRTNACAESICIDSGGLVASDDSDWMYSHENRLFQVKDGSH